MKRWIKRTLFGFVGASVAIGALTACAGRHEGPGMHASAEDSAKFRSKMVDRVSSKLDLDASQKQRLVVLADTLQAQRAALMAQTPDPRAEVRALVAGDKFDRSRAQALVTEKTAALITKSPEVIAAMGDFYDSLNTTQQQKVREFMERGRRWGHRG